MTKTVNVGGMQYRALELQRVEGEQDLIPVSLSSEQPVLRFDWMTGERYYEVLSHDPADVDLSRAQRGLPLLMDHDTRAQSGRLLNVRLEEARLVASMKFSRSSLGQTAQQDVRDGIREEVSIGYRVTKMTKVSEEDGVPTYRCAWMPYEGTLTAVPADYTVGVGRNADRAAFAVEVTAPATTPAPQAQEARMAEEITPAPAPTSGPTPRATIDDSARRDMAEIADICAVNNEPATRAAQFIREGMSPAAVKGKLFDEAVAKAKSGTPIAPPLTEGERKRYSFARGLLAAAGMVSRDQAGLEMEVSGEIAKRLGKEGAAGSSLFVPNDLEVRALGSATSGGGAEFKFTQPRPFIEMLREKLVVRAAGCTVLSGLTAPIAFPRQTVAGAATARTEVPGSDLADTDSTYDTLSMSAKTIQRNTAVSRQLLFQASEDVENLIRSDLAAVLALAVDAQALNGGGTNQIAGLLSNTSITTVTLGANGGTITYAALVGLERAVAIGNADVGRLAVVTNAQQRAQARQVQVFSGTNGVPLWVGGANGTQAMAVGEIMGPNGYSAYSSQQIPSNLTKGTATTICSAWVFGNYAELILGEWGAMEFIVDPYSKKKQALLEIEAIIYADVGVRHTASFAKIQDAL
jgi:HK97 family phage major capsid protein